MAIQTARPDPAAAILLRPFQRFFGLEAASGILLLLAAVVALVWANSPWSASYFHLWETHLVVGLGDFVLDKSLHHWINDGLMAVFFFVVGLEIKREVLVGELASPKAAALTVAAAVGGMAAPAAIYAVVNAGGPGSAGWGIPMATDIAFALGVLALLGSRVPLALKVFVTAIAIVDDLGAVVVIALFYTAEIWWAALGIGLVVLVLLMAVNRMGIRAPTPYVLLGIVLWVALLQSGIHATIAGVLLALTIPARRLINAPEFLRQAELYVAEFAEDAQPGRTEPTPDQRDAIHSLELAAEHVETPLTRLEHALHPWVAFFVMPVFALANAGVSLGGDVGAVMGSPVTLGVILGLFVGKQVGILAFAWAAVRTGLATLPGSVGWRQVWGVSLLCGIGFTMSLFIASLAFADPTRLDAAKIGILAASLVSGVGGAVVLLRAGRGV
ncbi:MAG TPA: Na+/H+ antiporter NhaA [Longimicrobiales bacterium]|nr:Na+/H+ antiporter NhaA [Longimicrobiales bacterium]